VFLGLRGRWFGPINCSLRPSRYLIVEMISAGMWGCGGLMGWLRGIGCFLVAGGAGQPLLGEDWARFLGAGLR
jgi:hypothetical protein